MLNELYGSLLTEKQRDMIRCYYDYDLSLGEIAEQYSVTRQAVADALKKGEKTLKLCEEKMGFMSKLAALGNGLKELESLLEKGDIQTAQELTCRLRKQI